MAKHLIFLCETSFTSLFILHNIGLNWTSFPCHIMQQNNFSHGKITLGHGILVIVEPIEKTLGILGKILDDNEKILNWARKYGDL